MTQQSNWKQCVWKREDGKDTGLIQVTFHAYTAVVMLLELYAFVPSFRNVALVKSMGIPHCTWHMQEICVSIVPVVVLVGSLHLTTENAQDP